MTYQCMPKILNDNDQLILLVLLPHAITGPNLQSEATSVMNSAVKGTSVNVKNRSREVRGRRLL